MPKDNPFRLIEWGQEGHALRIEWPLKRASDNPEAYYLHPPELGSNRQEFYWLFDSVHELAHDLETAAMNNGEGPQPRTPGKDRPAWEFHK